MKSLPLLAVLGIMFAIPAQGDALTSFARAMNKQNKANGIPFRFETKTSSDGTLMFQRMLPLPVGPSKADATLTADTLASISQKEHEKGRGDALLEEVHLMEDGGEVWTIKTKEDGIAYVVRFVTAAQGGIDMVLSGPYNYVR
jgi:hypothetical protein